MKIYGTSARTSNQTQPSLNLSDERAKFGLWITYRDAAVVETGAAEGFDWVCVDGQHGHAELADYRALFEAAHVYGIPAGVRVPSNEVGHLGRAIDAGARIVIVPTVETAQQALGIIETCRFAPRGKRSYGPTRLIPRYPVQTPGLVESDPLVALMIETAKGLENIDEILAAGPDAIFVGPYDLALSCGWTLEQLTLGDQQHVLREIAQRAAAAGVVPGVYAGEIGLARRMVELGFKFMPVSTDSALISMAARQLLTTDSAQTV
ncbi:2-dehydro-3-deoxyglucarate aldolase [Glutamicibacter uratoxydans]|uniref:2-dehydro-3-deoxyglucarate aldolase n=1 Tax=Glutamicibacter uratoxydans TaxID=43667 RepID=A0A4Y4DKE6_GLUUR|nr:aldolase/citrate lyase family protein [Glutamicibacter uratoxydans]GED05053.1 2-dehydro-3-deoxyglucarate aldolase [Glutamicibacter uratoxydans]